ncbi:MAG: diaminopimelate epimerase [Pseudomonadota bacterium]
MRVVPRGRNGYVRAMDGTGQPRRPLHFRKMHGLGNDFVIIDQREAEAPLDAALVRAIGDRHRGVGFDQLVEVLPGTDADAELIFWNADGSTAGACGNATRCLAHLMLAETGQQTVTFRTERGLLPCCSLGDGVVEVDMGTPLLGWDEIPLARDIDPLHLPLPGDPAACSMGNPHCTYFVDDIDQVDLNVAGPASENDPLFPERTNVQFVQVMGRNEARVRVWERGVGVTLASGSSSCAIVVNAHRRGLMDRQALLHLDGGDIQITWREDDHVLMAGPVSYVFEGVFDPRFP